MISYLIISQLKRLYVLNNPYYYYIITISSQNRSFSSCSNANTKSSARKISNSFNSLITLRFNYNLLLECSSRACWPRFASWQCYPDCLKPIPHHSAYKKKHLDFSQFKIFVEEKADLMTSRIWLPMFIAQKLVVSML